MYNVDTHVLSSNLIHLEACLENSIHKGCLSKEGSALGCGSGAFDPRMVLENPGMVHLALGFLQGGVPDRLNGAFSPIIPSNGV